MRGAGVAAALLAVILLTGCWDRMELNELSITSATAVDANAPDDYVMSYQVVIPSAISGAMGGMKGGAGQSPIIVYSTRGSTIRGAVQQGFFESPRKLFFSHNRVIVVSSDVARIGLEQVIDTYFRNSESRETVNILITDGKARDILEQLMQISVIPGEGIFETLRTENRLFSALPAINLYELAMQLMGSSHNAVLPEILISGSPPVTSNDQMGRTSLPSKLRLGRLAVLKDGKLTGWLKQDEALGVGFLHNTIHKTSVAVPCRATEAIKNSTVRIEHSHTKVVPVRQGDKLSMLVKIKADGTLMDSSCDLDLEKPDEVRQLEGQVRKTIIEFANDGYEATQRLQADVVGFADVVHRKYPGLWHKIETEWPARYAELPMKLQVEFTLKRVGLSSRSFKKLFVTRED